MGHFTCSEFGDGDEELCFAASITFPVVKLPTSLSKKGS